MSTNQQTCIKELVLLGMEAEAKEKIRHIFMKE